MLEFPLNVSEQLHLYSNGCNSLRGSDFKEAQMEQGDVGIVSFIVKCLYSPINIKLSFLCFLFDGFLMVYEMYVRVTKHSVQVCLCGM